MFYAKPNCLLVQILFETCVQFFYQNLFIYVDIEHYIIYLFTVNTHNNNIFTNNLLMLLYYTILFMQYFTIENETEVTYIIIISKKKIIIENNITSIPISNVNVFDMLKINSTWSFFKRETKLYIKKYFRMFLKDTHTYLYKYLPIRVS